MKTETFWTRFLRFVVILFSLGLVRGIIGFAIGVGLVYGLMVGIPISQGQEANKDLAVLLGGLLGTVLLLLFAGVFSDWLKWVFWR